jgi:DNA-3-methyladenine glycosylase II
MDPRNDRTKVIIERRVAEQQSLDGPEHMLVPRAPFCFRKAREIIASFSPTIGQVAVNEVVHRPLRIGGRTVMTRIVSHGSIENPRLGVTLTADGSEERNATPFLNEVADHLSINDELEPLYQQGLADPQFGMVVARLYGLHQVRFVNPFAAVCWALLSAHTRIGVLRSLRSSLLQISGSSMAGPNGPLWAFPEPLEVLEAGNTGSWRRSGTRGKLVT